MDRSAVLYDFAMEFESPCPDLLDEYCARYPDLAEELTDLAVELALDHWCEREAAQAIPATATDDPLVAKGMAVFAEAMARLHPALTEDGPE
jgi:hypothetical protein